MEIARDFRNGVFAGTNELIQRITGRPTTLGAFVTKHRAACR